jgi:hypothetical protein
VELRGFEPLTFCMPCMPVSSEGVASGPVTAGQVSYDVWGRLVRPGGIWGRWHGLVLACWTSQLREVQPCALYDGEMFTYNENRVLLVEQGRLEFPCDVTATIELYPSAVYGDSVPGVTCVLNSQAQLRWNANTGRGEVESNPPLVPPEVSATVGRIALKIVGHAVQAAWHCSSREQLASTLGALHFVLPLCLGLEFADSTIPAVTSGRAGEASFVWQVEQTGGNFEVMGVEERDRRLLQALDLLPLLCSEQNARLLAAVAYCERAHRLLAAGVGPSEFAGEAVTNLAKCLEAVFPGPPSASREAVRQGLSQLGYGSDVIEGVFVKAMVLRSSLDAAHVRMATLTEAERRKLQLFMERVIAEFRGLLHDLVKRVREGTLEVTPCDSERTADDDLARLLNSI